MSSHLHIHSKPDSRTRNRNRFSKILSLPILIMSLGMLVTIPLINTGCVAIAAVGAGAGAVAYLRGSLNSHLSANMDRCLSAVRNAVPRMGLVKVKEISDPSKAKFTFRDSLDTKITLTLSQRSHGVTEINIRVGQLGDESRSIQILNLINQELGNAPPR